MSSPADAAAGGPSVLVGCLEETRDTLEQLLRLGERPDHLVCITPEEAARQRLPNYVDMRPLAEAAGISWSTVREYSMKTPEDVELFRRLRPSALLVVGWQRLLPEAVLETAVLGTLGFHGSCDFLPWGRGRSPINWSIIEGRNRFILHMFLISPGVDDGDVVGMRVYDVNEWDDCRSLYYKTAIAQAELLALHLPRLRRGACPGLPQVGEPFYYPKRTPEDGRIDWSAPAEAICRLVRAVTWPYPGAFCFLEGERMTVWRAQPFSGDFFGKATPGEVCFTTDNGTGEFVVRCGDGTVLVTRSEGAVPRGGDVLS